MKIPKRLASNGRTPEEKHVALYKKQSENLLTSDEDIGWHFVVTIHHGENVKNTR